MQTYLLLSMPKAARLMNRHGREALCNHLDKAFEHVVRTRTDNLHVETTREWGQKIRVRFALATTKGK